MNLANKKLLRKFSIFQTKLLKMKKSWRDFIMSRQSVIIDNYTFRMHYRATSGLLLVFAIFIALGQIFGHPIECSAEKGSRVDTDMLDTFCWVHSTFTYATDNSMDIRANYTKNVHRGDIPDVSPVRYPGLLPPSRGRSSAPAEAQLRYHKYYPWVAFFLFIQAITFYFPRYLWKLWEGGKVKGLTDQLQTSIEEPIRIQNTNIEDSIKIEKQRQLVEYFHGNLHKHHYYAFKFFFCEIVNLINVIMQIFITDKFLGYQFLTYGSRVVQFKDEPSYLHERSSAHPMDEVFPKMSRCQVTALGSSSQLKTYDALCVLPTNGFNDKIFLFLWFWFVLLSVLSGISFLYRIGTFSPSFRYKLLCAELRMVDPQAVRIVSRQCNLGDWFMLYILALNMDPDIYKEFFSDLVLKYAQKQPY